MSARLSLRSPANHQKNSRFKHTAGIAVAMNFSELSREPFAFITPAERRK